MKTPYLVLAISSACAAIAAAQAAAPVQPPASSPAVASRAASQGDFERSLAWQIALDRLCLSPGLIDGAPGPKTATATREFQRMRGLAQSGALDDATAAALGLKPPIASYTVSREDVASVGELPHDWLAKSKATSLPYESLEASLAEKFHCTKALLGRLNPGVRLNELKPGDVIRVPDIGKRTPAAAASLEISMGQKVIRALDDKGALVGLFHCSIAADPADRPSGSAKVVCVTPNPTYRFDPAKWPEVKNVSRVLLIPPGPRNPVGLCWTGLSLPGYGIHGTPSPELIGKTGSHGCFRLPNWDAVTLGAMVTPGVTVTFKQ